jgi:hypothetical protein
MVRVTMADLKEGMVLAQPVETQGRFLLAEGVALTANHLRIFKTWGVADAAIEGDAPETGESSDPGMDSEEVRAVRAEIDRRFAKCNPDDEIIGELKKTVMKMTLDKRLQPAVRARG